jgi:hypothetical protein
MKKFAVSSSSLKSKAPRIQPISKEKATTPGPGQYNPKDFLTRDKSQNLADFGKG